MIMKKGVASKKPIMNRMNWTLLTVLIILVGLMIWKMGVAQPLLSPPKANSLYSENDATLSDTIKNNQIQINGILAKKIITKSEFLSNYGKIMPSESGRVRLLYGQFEKTSNKYNKFLLIDASTLSSQLTTGTANDALVIYTSASKNIFISNLANNKDLIAEVSLNDGNNRVFYINQ
jgi:hypothetical protein